MKRKRLLCAVLALVLLFSAPSAALAANANNMRTTVIDGDGVRLPYIQVTIPSRGTVYINPFKLPIAIGDGEVKDQIFSAPANIANKSNVPIEVDITVFGTLKPGSDMSLVSSPTGGTGTAKNAFVYFEIQQSDSDDPEDVTWDPAYDPAKHAAVIENRLVTYPGTLILPPRTLDGEVAPGGYAPFRLSGDAVKKPTNPWTELDGIDVIITYTFTPLPYPAS